MKLELDHALDSFDIFLLLEAIARETPDPGCLTIEDEEGSYPKNVSLGLEQAMYREIYPLGQDVLMAVRFPNGDSVTYSHWEPHALYASGTEWFADAVQRRIRQKIPYTAGSVRVISFDASCPLRELPIQDVVRRLFRCAASKGTGYYLTDANLNGKLVRVASVWLLNSYNKPMDVILRFPQGGFMVYHVDTGVTYASAERYSDVKAILKDILQM